MKILCTCLSGKTYCDCQVLESIASNGTNINRKDMTKEEIEQAAKDNWDSINGQFINGLNPHAHRIGFIEGSKWAESENERLKAERDSNWISLERAKKYARHQHYLGTQGNELVEFEDWECKPPKQ